MEYGKIDVVYRDDFNCVLTHHCETADYKYKVCFAHGERDYFCVQGVECFVSEDRFGLMTCLIPELELRIDGKLGELWAESEDLIRLYRLTDLIGEDLFTECRKFQEHRLTTLRGNPDLASDDDGLNAKTLESFRGVA